MTYNPTKVLGVAVGVCILVVIGVVVATSEYHDQIKSNNQRIILLDQENHRLKEIISANAVNDYENRCDITKRIFLIEQSIANNNVTIISGEQVYDIDEWYQSCIDVKNALENEYHKEFKLGEYREFE